MAEQQNRPTEAPARRLLNAGFAALAALFIAGGMLTGCSDDESDDTAASGPTSSTPTPESSPSTTSTTPSTSADRDDDGSDTSDRGQSGIGEPAESGRVTTITDGDTIKVSTDSGTMDVRVLGIDTPEVYFGEECWGSEASTYAQRTLGGQEVELRTDPTQDRTDNYDRALRYVIVDGDNYSVLAARAGTAQSYVYETPVQANDQIVAAERKAKSADKGFWGPPCNGSTRTQEPAPEPDPPAQNCAAGYSPCVPPPPPDLNCPDVDGPITVTGSDPHGFDRDGDGVGCE